MGKWINSMDRCVMGKLPLGSKHEYGASLAGESMETESGEEN